MSVSYIFTEQPRVWTPKKNTYCTHIQYYIIYYIAMVKGDILKVECNLDTPSERKMKFNLKIPK